MSLPAAIIFFMVCTHAVCRRSWILGRYPLGVTLNPEAIRILWNLTLTAFAFTLPPILLQNNKACGASTPATGNMFLYLIYSFIVGLVSEIGWTSFFGNLYIDIVLSIVALSCIYIISTNVPSLSESNWYDFSGGSAILTSTTYTLVGCFILSLINTVICNVKGQTSAIFSILAIVIKSFLLLCGPAIIAWIVFLIFVGIAIAIAVGIAKADTQARFDFVRKFGRKPDDGEAFAFMMSKEMNKGKGIK